jgi:ribose 5-phosphate isomerase B
MPQEKIVIAADHGGYALKEAVKEHLIRTGYAVTDEGTNGTDAVDYPDFGARAAAKVSSGLIPKGILICGSGVGMSIVANRFPGVRAALCLDEETARLSRQHNDANMLVLAGRKTDPETAVRIVETWLATPFEGGRHQKRLDKICSLKVDELYR